MKNFLTAIGLVFLLSPLAFCWPSFSSGASTNRENTWKKTQTFDGGVVVPSGASSSIDSPTFTGTATFQRSSSVIRSTQTSLTVNVDTSSMTVTDTNGVAVLGGVQEWIPFAMSDETTALVVGSSTTIYIPYAFTVTSIYASVATAPAGSTIIVDIHENGTTIMDTDKVSIDAGENDNSDPATPPAITDPSIAAYSRLDAIVDQVGSGTAGAGLKVWICGHR